MSHAKARLEGDLLLGSRYVAAAYAHRHADQVRRRCQHVACDIETRAWLYDIDAVVATFRNTARRLTSHVA